MNFNNSSSLETIAEETARLEESPEGSLNHSLSQMPVLNTGVNLHGKMLLVRTYDLPMVVVPTRFHYGTVKGQYDGSWDCIVVSSNNMRYGVGGHDINLSQSELRRSPFIEISISRDNVASMEITNIEPLTDTNTMQTV